MRSRVLYVLQKLVLNGKRTYERTKEESETVVGDYRVRTIKKSKPSTELVL